VSTGIDINPIEIGLRGGSFTRVLHTRMPVREYYWACAIKFKL